MLMNSSIKNTYKNICKKNTCKNTYKEQTINFLDIENLSECKTFLEDLELSKQKFRIKEQQYEELIKKAPYTSYAYAYMEQYLTQSIATKCLESIINKYPNEYDHMHVDILNDMIINVPEKINDNVIRAYLNKVHTAHYLDLEDYILDIANFVAENNYKDTFNKQICDLVYSHIKRTNGHIFIHAYPLEHQFLIENLLMLKYDTNIVFNWIKNIQEIEYFGLDIVQSIFNPIITRNQSLESIFALYEVKSSL